MPPCPFACSVHVTAPCELLLVPPQKLVRMFGEGDCDTVYDECVWIIVLFCKDKNSSVLCVFGLHMCIFLGPVCSAQLSVLYSVYTCEIVVEMLHPTELYEKKGYLNDSDSLVKVSFSFSALKLQFGLWCFSVDKMHLNVGYCCKNEDHEVGANCENEASVFQAWSSIFCRACLSMSHVLACYYSLGKHAGLLILEEKKEEQTSLFKLKRILKVSQQAGTWIDSCLLLFLDYYCASEVNIKKISLLKHLWLTSLIQSV